MVFRGEIKVFDDEDAAVLGVQGISLLGFRKGIPLHWRPVAALVVKPFQIAACGPKGPPVRASRSALGEKFPGGGRWVSMLHQIEFGHSGHGALSSAK